MKEPFNKSLKTFLTETNKILSGTARGKGYAKDSDGGRKFYDAVSLASDDENGTHAKGEIVYKVKRWSAKKDPTDLIKIAAWAFLLWDEDRRKK